MTGGLGDGYPETVGTAPIGLLTALGNRYLQETAAAPHGAPTFHRQAAEQLQPRRTDPGDPAARDHHRRLRRHPMDCLFQHLQAALRRRTAPSSYDLDDLGRYYRCYLSLMDHWDAVLPCKVLHVQYEDLVREPELNIRRLLAHCRLAAVRSRLASSFPPGRGGPCAPQAPNKYASRSTPPVSATGGTSRRSFSPCGGALGDSLQRFEHLHRQELPSARRHDVWRPFRGLTTDTRTKDDPVT